MLRSTLRITLYVFSTICLWSAFLLVLDWREVSNPVCLAFILLLCGVGCILLAWFTRKGRCLRSRPVDGEPEGGGISAEEAKGEDFNSQFDSYKRDIESWMRTERPYLNVDFSLQEVINRFKLNRTYASRIFNDGFGQSFLLVVREYRIAYAKELMRDNPGMSLSDVAQQCGYSTVQAFHKAFAYCNGGMTPGRYAQSLKGEGL